MFGMDESFMSEADLSLYTEEEVELAQKMHDEECFNGCSWGAFRSWSDPYGWLNLARAMIKDRPQKEVLF